MEQVPLAGPSASAQGQDILKLEEEEKNDLAGLRWRGGDERLLSCFPLPLLQLQERIETPAQLSVFLTPQQWGSL